MIIVKRKGITTPRAIRKLLRKYNMAVFLLSSKEFRRMCKYHNYHRLANPPSAMLDFSNYFIYIDAERLIIEKERQSYVNYLYLHEIAHGLLNMGNKRNEEIDAHELALKIAGKEKLPVDYTDVIL